MDPPSSIPPVANVSAKAVVAADNENLRIKVFCIMFSHKRVLKSHSTTTRQAIALTA
jgi:hypothetical protein